MSRYAWPGQRDPHRKDRGIMRRDFNLAYINQIPAQLHSMIAQMRAGILQSQPDPDANLWIPLGPSTVLRGQAGGAPRVSGRVRDLWINGEGTRAYAATASGGVWYSQDSGTSWAPVGGWANTPSSVNVGRAANVLACGCLLVDFGTEADGSADRVWVGTGELQPARQAHPGGQLGGVGVLRLATPLPEVLADPLIDPWVIEGQDVLTGSGIYRLARHPINRDVLVAATSKGLFARDPLSFAWSKVQVDPFNFSEQDNKWCTDAVWIPRPGSTSGRLWVTLIHPATFFSGTGLYYSDNEIAGPFQRVGLADGYSEGRLGIAVAPSDPTVLYVLGKGPRLWRVTGTTAQRVHRLPNRLFGESENEDQSHYDLAVQVHPERSDRVTLGGSGIRTASGAWEASLFTGQVTGVAQLDFPFTDTEAGQASPGADATFIGQGVHADVHAIRYVRRVDRLEMWIACDGGIFRSLRAGALGSFVSRNTGLAALEPGYVDSHPTHDGVLIAGTQDNGVLRRIGDTVWEHSLPGDGGGVAFHPIDARFFIGQYTQGSWRVNDWRGWVPPVERPGDSQDSIDRENEASLFYSGVTVRVASQAAGTAQVAIGTNRVWISENWRLGSVDLPPTSWRTLPSGNDPRDGDAEDTGSDVLEGGAVIALRWGSANRLFVLTRRAVICFTRTAGTVGTVSTWHKDVISAKKEKNYGNNSISATGAQDHLPPLGGWSDLSIHEPGRGTFGSFYVSTTGHADLNGNVLVDFDRMDTLWWFDGTSTWYRTNLRGDTNRRTKAPAYAVVCDPTRPEIVYVGTTVGVWRGTLDLSGTTPSWTWEPLLNGLPQAAVEDLSLFTSGDTRLLRAALQARGVWELDLSATPMPVGRTYLRAHPVDTRRTSPSAMADPITPGTAQYRWYECPDIAIRPSPGPPAPARPPVFPLTWGYHLWVFQLALRTLNPAFRPDGTASEEFRAALRAYREDRGLSTASPDVDLATWNQIMTEPSRFFVAPWDGPEPTEADLAELVVNDNRFPTFGGTLTTTISVRRRPYSVDVLVHHRHIRPIPASEVSVLLLRRQVATTEAPDAIALSAAWKSAVVAWLGGATPALDGGWIANPGGIGHPGNPIDARTPRAVTFNFDATGLAPNTTWVLLAIVSSSRDAISAASLPGIALADLVMRSHHVGARLITISGV